MRTCRRPMICATRSARREKFRISATYYLLVTGELEKAIQTYEVWTQTYPRNSEPFGNLGVDYVYLRTI